MGGARSPLISLLASLGIAAVARADPESPSVAAGPDVLVVSQHFEVSLRSKETPNTKDAERGLVDFVVADGGAVAIDRGGANGGLFKASDMAVPPQCPTSPPCN